MKIEHTADGGLVVVPDSPSDNVSMDDMGVHLIISIKEARKLLGKTLSDEMTDDHLADVVACLSYLASTLLRTISVP